MNDFVTIRSARELQNHLRLIARAIATPLSNFPLVKFTYNPFLNNRVKKTKNATKRNTGCAIQLTLFCRITENYGAILKRWQIAHPLHSAVVVVAKRWYIDLVASFVSPARFDFLRRMHCTFFVFKLLASTIASRPGFCLFGRILSSHEFRRSQRIY